MDLAAKPLLEIAEQLLANEFALGGLEVSNFFGHRFAPLDESWFGDGEFFGDAAVRDSAGAKLEEFRFEFGRVLHSDVG
jgi:hypothetical protein